MKVKIILGTVSLCLTTVLFGQVGIGTNFPHNSAQLEVQSTSKGLLTPRMTMAQRNNIATPQTGLIIYQTDAITGFYLYDGVSWIRLMQESFGDVKSGFQTNDHNGWIKLDGRLLSTLSASQLLIAQSLGFVGNLPDASNAYLSQNGASMGALSGSNAVTLTQGNLPIVNFTGSAANAGSHSHNTDPAAFNSGNAGNHSHSTDPAGFNSNSAGSHNHVSYYTDPNNSSGPNGGVGGGVWFGVNATTTSVSGDHAHFIDVPSTLSSAEPAHAHSIDVPSTASTTAPDHSHSVTVSSGGSATPITTSPRTLTVNMFIYLGN